MQKNGLFVRPNLRLFVLGAIVLLAVEQLVSSLDCPDSGLVIATGFGATMPKEEDLQRLLEQAIKKPTAENYLLISDCLRKRGDAKQAMLYLRKATLAADIEEALD